MENVVPPGPSRRPAFALMFFVTVHRRRIQTLIVTLAFVAHEDGEEKAISPPNRARKEALTEPDACGDASLRARFGVFVADEV